MPTAERESLDLIWAKASAAAPARRVYARGI
jgi:hypothetical protein